jgi:hypothetical protein
MEGKRMNERSNNDEQRVKEIFRQAERNPLEPSPFLKTRILARVREAKAERSRFHWKVWALASSAATLLLLTVILWPMKSALIANVNQQVAVRVEVKALDKNIVAYAKVELPDGVSFVSTKYPELEKEREVSLAWMPEFDRSGLPVVIQASSVGKKTIRILLLDRNNAVRETKEVTITFQGSA